MIKIDGLLQKIMVTFDESFINYNSELMVIPSVNISFRLDNVYSDTDLKRKILEYVSRSASKGIPYSQKWENDVFNKEILNSINAVLNTSFSEKDIDLIYTCLGNGINPTLANKFIAYDYDMKILEDYENWMRGD